MIRMTSGAWKSYNIEANYSKEKEAGVSKLVYDLVSKTRELNAHEGSTPSPGTNFTIQPRSAKREERKILVLWRKT